MDIVSLPQYMFEAKTGLHPKYKYIEKTTHIIIDNYYEVYKENVNILNKKI